MRTRRLSIVVIPLAVAVAIATSASAAGIMQISPTHLRFGKQTFGSFTTGTITITNTSTMTVVVTIETVDVPDDFSPGQPESTCFLEGVGIDELAPGASCTQVVAFQADPFFKQPETATLLITARDPTGVLLTSANVKISGKGV